MGEHDCKSPEDCWDDYWLPLWDEAGEVTELYADREELSKKELYDFHALLNGIPLILDVVTDGAISKPNTMAFEVIREFEEYLSRERDEAWQEGYEMGKDEGYEAGQNAIRAD